MDLPTLFFDDHPNPMIIFDTRTLVILEVNESAIKKYGYSRQEFRNLTIEDIRPPEDLPRLREQLEELDDKSKILDIGTFRHLTKDKKIIHVQLATQPFPVRGRKARIVHIHDITETIRLKNEVEEAYREQKHHLDNNPLGMVKYDHDFRILEWSERAEEKTGYSKEEVIGTSTFDMNFFEKDEEEKVKERMLEISSGLKDKDRFETVISLRDGGKMEVLIHASALRTAGDDLKSVVAFIENITDRKKYQRELQKRERKYHSLFEEANDGILLLKGLKIIDCNRRSSEIFDTTKDHLIGQTPLDFSPDTQPDGQSSSEKAQQLIDRVMNGTPQVFEWQHETKGGKNVNVEVSLNKLELGENDYIQAVLRDLTEHKEIKNELEAERQRLKRAQELAKIGWWTYKVKDDHVIWSDMLFDILNVNKQNFDSDFEAFNQLVHPDDRGKLANVMQRARETHKPLDYILRIGDGSEDIKLIAKCRAQSTFDDEGELIKMSGVLQDITKQHKAQEELKRREKLFQSLFLDSPVAIVMIDLDGTVQQVNQSFEHLFGYTEDEIVGKDLLTRQLPEERYDEIDDIYERVFSDEGASKYYEDQRITKSGEIKNLLVGALPVTIDGEPIAAFGIYTDITRLRKTEESLQKSLKEKEILLSEIHHRVKNNLAVISGLLMLESMNWDPDSEVSKVLMQSKLRIHSMAQIHEQLYKSKDFASLDLENYIHELVETIYQSMQGKEMDVDIDISCDDVTLNINQALPCALVVNELVTNSFKYAFNGKKKGNLEVMFQNKNGIMTIEVADNGPGLPDDYKQMIEKSLGHRLVNQLVKQLDGEIEVESSRESGTHYEIRFEKNNKSGSSSNYFV